MNSYHKDSLVKGLYSLIVQTKEVIDLNWNCISQVTHPSRMWFITFRRRKFLQKEKPLKWKRHINKLHNLQNIKENHQTQTSKFETE